VVIGGGLGIAVKNLITKSSNADFADAIVILISATGFLFAALATLRLKKFEIGPHEHEISGESRGFKEMLEGFHILRNHPDALRGIIAIGIQRGGITALTLMALLLERNLFNSSDDPDAGLAGFGVALAIAGIGIGIGAIISPYGVIKFGRHLWMRILMFACLPWLFFFAIDINEVSMIICAFFVGMCGQGMKVTNDALVQSKIKDEFRGRVFAFYDVAVNAGIVSSALIAALVMPTTGNSNLLPILIATAYLFAATIILRGANFSHATK
jgi:MFS family permease